MTKTLAATLVLLAPTTLAFADSKGAPPRGDGKAAVAPEATGHGARNGWWPEQGTTPSLSEVYGLEQLPAPLFQMPVQDNDYYMAEDELVGSGKGPTPLRFAFEVAAPITMDDGEWIKVEGGMLWRAVIASPNASTARVRLSGLNVPAGQEVRLSSPGFAGTTVGPIEGVGEFGTGDAWSMALPTGEVLVEWFVPSGSAVNGLPFGGVTYLHGYRDIYAAFNNQGDGGVAGNCHNQPSCYSAWLNESNATVRLIFGGFLCSGQLTATTAADETPYVSTANHCISTQADANSCQFNFFYRTPTCNAAVSAGTTITGSDLVLTQLASDCTLLMIRPTLPTGVFWCGWTGSSVTTNTGSTGIHHPGGAPQAISFGVKNANSFNCGSPTTNWSSLSWNNGITEGGSSGSAIYRDSDKKMYGVLTCGASSCQNTAADDGYGRWDVAVNTGGFAAQLAAGSDDTLEPNDTCATARPTVAGTYSNLVVKRLDEDWYALNMPTGSTLNANFTFTHANGDVDIDLYGTCGGAAILQRTANVNNETFSWVNTTANTTIYMRVYLGADTRNNYSMTIGLTVPVPENDECVGSTLVGEGSYPFNSAAASTSTPTVAASCTDGAGSSIFRDLWYRVNTLQAGTATVSTCGASFDTRIVVYSVGGCPTATTNVYACDDNGCGTASTVTFPCVEDGLYLVRVGSKTDVGGAGTLVVAVTPAPQCPADLDGNGSVDSADLAQVLGSWGVCAGCPADLDGSGSVDSADLAQILGAWGACP